MLFAFVILILPCFATIVPEDPVEAVLTRSRECQEFFLAQLRPDVPPLPRDIEPIEGDLPVYHVRLTDQATGILSANFDRLSAPYAALYSELIFQSPTVLTSLARVIEPTDALDGSLTRAKTDNVVHFRTQQPEHTDKVPLLLTLQLPGLLGSEYLEAKTAYALRRELATFHWVQLGQNDQLDERAARLEALWAQAGEDTRRDLKQDLIELMPFLDETPDEEMITTFTKMEVDLTYYETAPLFNRMALKRLPEAVQVQIADLWALAYAMGADFFNAGNWLITPENERLVAVNLNRWSTAFEEGLEEYSMLSPIASQQDLYFELDKDFEAFLREKVSAEMTHFLAGLSYDAVQNHCDLLKFKITFFQKEGLVKRAHSFPPKRIFR